METRADRTNVRAIERRDFEKFRRLIRDACGISLGDTKDALLTSRLARRMLQLGYDSHSDYYEAVVADRSGAELQRLVDSISTNVTSFFREAEHFSALHAHLEQLSAAGQHEVRLWSAACSTGEEPYSMAMVCSEATMLGSTRVRILATDISTGALATAHLGRYPAEKVAKLPAEYVGRYLKRRGGDYEVGAVARSMVTFSPINLAKPPFPMRGPFDAVFCRNVMIYFAPDTRRHLVAEIERLLAPGGLLMLGHAESLAGMGSSLKAIAPAVYRKAGR